MNKHTAELLEKHFDAAFSAPDGIKKLRELILTLAMQGRLVPQDPEDQPAVKLLKEIDARKLQIAKDRKTKKLKPLPPVSAEETPHALPQGWTWARLGELVEVLNGRAYKQNELLSSGTPVLRVGNLFTSKHWYYSNLELEEDKYLDKGDLIYAWSASFGPFIWKDDRVIYHYHIWKLKFFVPSAPDKNFLYNFLLDATDKIKSSGNGIAMLHMTKERMEKLLIPLPPLAEQYRIVDKIKDLMARCDALEKLRTTQQEARLNVHASAIKQLLNIAEPEQHQRAQSFLAEHFGELYTVKENVAELRKAILQIAVMGRLVAQNENEGSVSDLLKRIEEERLLQKSGRTNFGKQLPLVTTAEIPFTLPLGWEWIRLGSLALSSDSGWSPQCHPEPRVGQDWGVLKVSAVSWGKFDSTQNKSLPVSQEPRPECEVKNGDFLISRANTDELVARSVVVEEVPPHLMMSDKIVRFKLSSHVNKAFINIVNGTTYARAYYMANASGTSSSMKNVTRETISLLPVPLPPLQEQHRIVAKIGELMTLCDSLDQQIDEAASKQKELLSVLMQVQSQGNLLEQYEPEESVTARVIDLGAYRAVIGCYTVGKLAAARYFGRTAAAKVMYLAQAHAGLELNLRPERKAAGPLDTWIYDFEREGQSKGWFKVNEKTLTSGATKAEYRCLPGLSEPVANAETLMTPDQRAEFDRLIYALANKKTEEVEVIATLFAVWNDFLIDGIQPTNEQIIVDMRENWHSSKERFEPAELGKWIEWLRKENFVPRGLPPRTIQQQQLKMD